jgi:hypothetical protein
MFVRRTNSVGTFDDVYIGGVSFDPGDCVGQTIYGRTSFAIDFTKSVICEDEDGQDADIYQTAKPTDLPTDSPTPAGSTVSPTTSEPTAGPTKRAQKRKKKRKDKDKKKSKKQKTWNMIRKATESDN